MPKKTPTTTLSSKLVQNFLCFMAYCRVYQCGKTVNVEERSRISYTIYEELCKAFINKSDSPMCGPLFSMDAIRKEVFVQKPMSVTAEMLFFTRGQSKLEGSGIFDRGQTMQNNVNKTLVSVLHILKPKFTKIVVSIDLHVVQ